MKSDYNTKSDGYFAMERPDIVRFVKSNQNAVLDVGCGAGKMAYQLKQSKNVNEVWGIELVESAGKKAEQLLDKVIISPVENAIDQLPDKYFDTIIFADVLEHLIEPLEVLIKMKQKLKPNGEIITSIPNIRHWSIIKQLLEGDWNYEEFGLLDRTHLRFFTKKTALQLFKDAGYFPTLLAAKQLDSKIDISDTIINKLIEFRINAQTLQEEANDFQYIISGKLQKNAVIVDVPILNKNITDKLMQLSESAKQNLEIFLLYDEFNETVNSLIDMASSSKYLHVIKNNELQISLFDRIIKVEADDFALNELENYITQQGFKTDRQIKGLKLIKS